MRIMGASLLTASLAMALAALCSANSTSTTPFTPSEYWDVKDFPNPRYEPTKCGRDRSSYVCDPNKLLRDYQTYKLDKIIADVTADTTCACVTCPTGRNGYMMAVAIVPWLKLPSSVPRTKAEVQQQMEYFSVTLRKTWNFGYCTNDLVLVLSINDRKVFTSTGRATNRKLSSTCVDHISANVKDLLRAERYADAVGEILTQFKHTIQADGTCGSSEGVTNSVIIGAAIGGVIGFIVLVSCCCLICWCSGCVGRGGGGGGGGGGSSHYHHSGGYWGGGGGSGGGGGGGGGGGFSSGDGGGGGGSDW